MLGIDPDLDMEVVFKPNAFVHTNRHWKDSGRRVLRNGGNGHCGYVSLLQLRAIMQGFASHEVEDAFLTGCPEFRAKLIDASREMAIDALLASGDSFTLDGAQKATTELEIRGLAFDDSRSITNLLDAVNVMGYVDRDGRGGYADDRALYRLASGLGMEKLELVREVEVEGETLLMGVDGESTALAGVSMVMWQPGHWSAIASNVSPSPGKLITILTPPQVQPFSVPRFPPSLRPHSFSVFLPGRHGSHGVLFGGRTGLSL